MKHAWHVCDVTASNSYDRTAVLAAVDCRPMTASGRRADRVCVHMISPRLATHQWVARTCWLSIKDTWDSLPCHIHNCILSRDTVCLLNDKIIFTWSVRFAYQQYNRELRVVYVTLLLLTHIRMSNWSNRTHHHRSVLWTFYGVA